MNKTLKAAAIASLLAASASAFWGDGYNMGDMVNDFFGDALPVAPIAPVAPTTPQAPVAQ